MIFPAALAAAALTSTSALSATIFEDEFDFESGGETAANYVGFVNWDVTSGTVDIKGPTNLRGTTGLGSYVDLDGTSAAGGTIVTKAIFAFDAGDLVTMSFDASGNQLRQRLAADDDIVAGFRFAGATPVHNYRLGGGFGDLDLGSLTGAETSNGVVTAWNSTWRTYTVSFKAGTAGSLQAFLGTNSDDNYGPMVDNFRLTIASTAPEPVTWAMMVLGFGGVGITFRRSRQRAMVAAYRSRGSAAPGPRPGRGPSLRG